MSSIKDIQVIDFYFSAGIKGPVIKAMANVNLERASTPQVTWFDLLPDETAALIQIAHVVEHRLLTSVQPVDDAPQPAPKRPIGFEKPE